MSSGTAATFSATMPPGARCSRHEPEELARGEIEGDIGLSIRVDDDQVVALVRSTEERTSVDVVHRQPRVVLHPEVPAADAAHRRIELDAVDLGVGVVDAERTRRRPSGVPEDRDPLERPPEQRRQREERVPHAAREHGVCTPDRVHGDAFVEMEQAPAVGALDDADVLVERRLLVDETILGLDRSRRHDEQRREQARHDEEARAEEEARRRGEQRRDDEKRALRPYRGNQHERGQEDAEERTGGRQRVETARDRACRRDRRDGEADRERRDHAEQDDSRRAEEEHGEEAPDDRARRRGVEAVDREVEERLGCEGNHGDAERRGEHDEAEEPRLRPPVREASAEPVAESERPEDDPDQVRPHDRRRAEVRREEPRRGDLRRERADPGTEDERAEREASGALPGHVLHLQAEDALDLAQRAGCETPVTTTTSASTSQNRTPAHRFSR